MPFWASLSPNQQGNMIENFEDSWTADAADAAQGTLAALSNVGPDIACKSQEPWLRPDLN